MTTRLKDADRRAVDLFLNHHTSGPGNGGQTNGGRQEALAASEVRENNCLARRLQCVEKLMQLLHELPADDPPGDLAYKTLQRLEQSQVAAPSTARPASQSPSPNMRPMA